MTEEQKKNLELLIAEKFLPHEIQKLLPMMEIGFSFDVILLADEQVRERTGKRNVRMVEGVLYRWHEKGWHTVEEIKAGDCDTRVMPLLQIKGRFLTAAERKYAESWVAMGFDDGAISMAYERTCLNTGGLNWAYLNKILERWHEKGLHTGKEIREGDGIQSQKREENLQIKKLEDEIAQLKGKVIELQDSLIKELDRVRQLMEENAELRQAAARNDMESGSAKTMDLDTMGSYINAIGRSELWSELEERPNKYPRYLKAIRVSLVELGYDEQWVDTTFRDALEKAYMD